MAKVLICCHGADGIQFLGIDTPYGVRSWDKLRPIAEEAGFVVVVLDLGNDNFHNADIVDDAIMARPAGDEISLIAHSMGGLSARLALKRYGTTRVRDYIALDTPQYGDAGRVWLNLQCWPTSRLIRELNTPDETPGATLYVQLTSRYPQLLPGVKSAAFPAVEHKDMVTDDAVLALVMKILGGDLTGLN